MRQLDENEFKPAGGDCYDSGGRGGAVRGHFGGVFDLCGADALT
jgi:hypothetical protein